MANDVLQVLTSISKFNKKINIEVLFEGRVELNGKILKSNVQCEIGDSIRIARDQYKLDWDLYTII